jgi:Ribosomal protein L10
MRGLEWKIKEVEDLKNAIRDHKVVGLVGMEDLPSKQLQEVRNRLRGKIKIKMKKTTSYAVPLKDLTVLRKCLKR